MIQSLVQGFEFLPESGLNVISGELKVLEEILDEEGTLEYQSLFERLDDSSRQNTLAELIQKDCQECTLDIDFLAYLIGYTYQIFKDTKRKVQLKGILIYNLSHVITTARIGARMGLPPVSIYLLILHDNVEQILDAICESRYSINLSDLEQMSVDDLRNMIFNLQDYFPKLEGAGSKLKKITAKKQRDVYTLLTDRVLYIMLQDFFKIAETVKVNREDIFGLINGVGTITRIPDEPYGNTIQRIESIDNYKKFYDLDMLFKPTLQIFRKYLESIRINDINAKLIDGLHNISTYGELKIPLTITKGNRSQYEELIDNRMKSLNKRLHIDDYTKEKILDAKNDNFFIPNEYLGMYTLHLLVAFKSAQEAKKYYTKVEEQFGGQEINDETLLEFYGFKGKIIWYRDLFNHIRDALRNYEERGLLDRVTTAIDPEEKKFFKKYHVRFAGTVIRTGKYADNLEDGSLYEGFSKARNVVDFFRDALVHERIFNRFLGLGIDGEYDPVLREKQLKGFGIN